MPLSLATGAAATIAGVASRMAAMKEVICMIKGVAEDGMNECGEMKENVKECRVETRVNVRGTPEVCWIDSTVQVRPLYIKPKFALSSACSSADSLVASAPSSSGASGPARCYGQLSRVSVQSLISARPNGP